MSWNGSVASSISTSKESALRSNANRPKSKTFRSISIWVFVVIIGLLTTLYFKTRKRDIVPNSLEGESRAPLVKIIEKKPVAAKKNIEGKGVVKKHSDPRVDPDTGIVVRPPWKQSKYGVITNHAARTTGIIGMCFKHTADRQLAWFLTLEPGDSILCPSSDESWLYENFNRDFEEACKEPIEDLPDDTEYMRNLKASVRELREDMKKRRAAGEDLGKLMLDSRKEALELAAYRTSMSKEVTTLLKDSTITEDDAKKLVECANEMLRGRGAKELSLPETFIRRIQLKKKQELKRRSRQ